MPPKGKSKAKAKPKAKTKAAQGTAEVVPAHLCEPLPGPEDGFESAEENHCDSGRSHLDDDPKPSPRKDIVTEKEKELRAQIGRNKARKLKGYDEDELKMAVGITTGLSIDQYIRKGLSELHGQGKNISSKWWADFFKEFPLGALMFQGIGPFLKTEKRCCSSDRFGSVVGGTA